MTQLRLSFLGTFEAMLGEQPIVHFRSSKVQGLLIYLVLTSGQTHPRDKLATLLWPEESDAAAKHNLRQSLFRLRKVLGETDTQPFLIASRASIEFNPGSNYSLDVARLLSHIEAGELEAAAALYRGDLLPGFSCDSLPFDSWLRQEREKLHRQALNALVSLADRHLQQGDHSKAQRMAQKQLELEPWREEAHRQLIQALALAGERSAALAQYEKCRQILSEELGVKPTLETEQLVEQIRKTNALPSAERSSAGHRQLTIPFAGRQAEFERLTDAFRRTAHDGIHAVTIIGKAGIGKTRLTQHFLAWAAIEGADVLSGRSFETSTGLSYQPLVSLFRQRLERENAPEDLLTDFWLSQLTRLLPELRERYPDLPPPTQDPMLAKQHLFEAVTRLGQALAERRPLVLFIDDWQWADSASIDLLQYAAVRWSEENLPIFLVMTLRQEEVTSDIQSGLNRLTQTLPAEAIQLSELTLPETLALINRLFPAEDADASERYVRFCEWLYAETSGQPLFLAETLKVLTADGLIKPNQGETGWEIDWEALDLQGVGQRALSGIQTIIRGWLDRISESAKAVLTAVSVLEQEASFEYLSQVAALEELQVIDALDELMGKQLLLELKTAVSAAGLDVVYSFSHQKISDVVYAEAGTARQRLLHRRAFSAFQAATAPPAECAYHALKAGLSAESVHYSIKAGQEAMSAFATRVALGHFETAWDVSHQRGWSAVPTQADREALFTGLGRAYETTNAWEKAKETYEEMLAFAREVEAPIIECKSLNALAVVYAQGLQNSRHADDLLEQARAVAAQSGNQLGLVETELNLAFTSRMREDFKVIIHSENALAMAQQIDHPSLLARCYIENAYLSFPLRRWGNLKTYWNAAHQLFRDSGNRIWAEKCQPGIAWAEMTAGNGKQTLLPLQNAHDFTLQIESIWDETEVVRTLAMIQLELGEYGRALEYLQRAQTLSEQASIPTVKTMTHIYTGIVQRTVLSLDSATIPLAEMLEEFLPVGMPGMQDWLAAELCAVAALRDDWTEAHRYAKLAYALRNEVSFPPVGFTGHFETEALLRGGDGDIARADVEWIDGQVGQFKRYRLPILRSRAFIAQWDGDGVQAIQVLEEALALAQEMDLPGEEWVILGELGRLYAEQGEQSKAREAYGAAAVIIQRLANTIEDDSLRNGFLSAGPVRMVLDRTET